MIMIVMIMTMMVMFAMVVTMKTVDMVHVSMVMASTMDGRCGETIITIKNTACLGRGSGGFAGRLPRRQFPKGDEKTAALDEQKPQTDQDDETIADDLDDVDGQSDRLRRRSKKNRSDRDDNNSDDGLNGRRGERQDNTSTPGLFVGDEIGGNDGFAMPGADGMKNAVEERDSEQAPHRGAVILARPDEAGQRSVESRLLGEDPRHQARLGRNFSRMMWRSERRALRPCGIDHGDGEDRSRDHQHDRTQVIHVIHGHFTKILLAKISPYVLEASSGALSSWLSRNCSAGVG